MAERQIILNMPEKAHTRLEHLQERLGGISLSDTIQLAFALLDTLSAESIYHQAEIYSHRPDGSQLLITILEPQPPPKRLAGVVYKLHDARSPGPAVSGNREYELPCNFSSETPSENPQVTGAAHPDSHQDRPCRQSPQ